MTIKNQSDLDLADAGRMLAKEISNVANELRRRGYTVDLSDHYFREYMYWEFEVKRVTEERI